MGVKPGVSKYNAHRRLKAAEMFFPDTYRIYPLVRVIDEAGQFTETWGAPHTYNGLADIPCRLDEARRYQDVDIYDQEAIFNAYEMFVPFDAPLHIDERIEITSTSDPSLELDDFEVKRLNALVSNRTTKSAIIATLDTGAENPE